MRKSINFVLSASSNYLLVQRQILGTIQKHLHTDEYSLSEAAVVPGALNFSLFIRSGAEVVMSHGAADKNYLYTRAADGERIVNSLKHVFVPGNWLKNRLLASKSVKLDPDQVHVVGWPRLDALLELRAAHQPERGHERRLKVLWAPTHDFARRGADEISTSSYPALLEHVPEIEREFALSISLHPRNRHNKRPTAELLIEADVVISDFGTLVYEAWLLGKPVIFPHWLIGAPICEFLPRSAEAKIFRERIGLHAGSFKEMLAILRSGPKIGDDVKAFLAEYVDPGARGHSGKRVAELLRELAP